MNVTALTYAAQNHHRMRLEPHLLAGKNLRAFAELRDRLAGIDDRRPAIAPRAGRQREFERFVMGVEEDVVAVVDDRLTVRVGSGNGVAIQKETESAGEAVIP